MAIEDIVLNSLTEGSIDVSGVISASSADDAADTSSSLSGATDSVGTSLGYSVISSDVNVYYNDQVYEEQDGDGDETTFLEENVGLIVGVTVGAIVVIAIVIFVVYKYKKKTSEGQLADESEIDVKGAKQ